MPLLISDANIFIDFEEAGILDVLFQLSDTLAVPDILFEEELRVQHEYLLGLGLMLMELGANAVERTVLLAERYRRPSRLDLAALALAEQEGCPLLTGDGYLRTTAEKEGVEVRGTIWLCERLHQEKVISSETLASAYRRMRLAGRRLPWEETHRQLKRLGDRRVK